jgi:hypothetical protein
VRVVSLIALRENRHFQLERKPINNNNRENVNQVLLIIGGVKVLSYVFLLEEEGEGKNRK